jgi:hypothetical protein
MNSASEPKEPTGNDYLRALLGEGDGGGAPYAREGFSNQHNRCAHDRPVD